MVDGSGLEDLVLISLNLSLLIRFALSVASYTSHSRCFIVCRRREMGLVLQSLPVLVPSFVVASHSMGRFDHAFSIWEVANGSIANMMYSMAEASLLVSSWSKHDCNMVPFFQYSTCSSNRSFQFLFAS
jgi:hypothetical protein